MQSSLGLSKNWVNEGIIIFGIGYFILFTINIILRRKERLLAGSIVGAILSLLDMVLMNVLWHIPSYFGAFVIGFFGYSLWVLIFKIEKLDYNGRILMIATTSIIITYIENIVVGGLGTGKVLYPVKYWTFVTTFVYFLLMLTLGTLLYLLIYKKLTKDEGIKIIEI